MHREKESMRHVWSIISWLLSCQYTHALLATSTAWYGKERKSFILSLMLLTDESCCVSAKEGTCSTLIPIITCGSPLSLAAPFFSIHSFASPSVEYLQRGARLLAPHSIRQIEWTSRTHLAAYNWSRTAASIINSTCASYHHAAAKLTGAHLPNCACARTITLKT